MLKEKIMEICGQELTTAQLIAAVETAISLELPFDHAAENAVDACKIDVGNLTQKLDTFGEFESNMSGAVEKFEQLFTKREASYLFTVQYMKIMQNPLIAMLLSNDD